MYRLIIIYIKHNLIKKNNHYDNKTYYSIF